MKKSFFGNVKKEWQKITWLTKDEIKRDTTVTVITTIVMGLLIAAMDFGGQWLVKLAMGFHF